MTTQTNCDGYIVEVSYYRRNDKITYSYIMGSNIVFSNIEKTWLALANAYEKFMCLEMTNRNPKIYIDNTGFIIDCYDDEDYVVESYRYKIKHMRFV